MRCELPTLASAVLSQEKPTKQDAATLAVPSNTDGELRGKPLSITHPQIAAQWHPTLNGDLKPDMITPGSPRTVYWQCPESESHVYPRQIYLRTKKGAPPCPACSGRIVDKSTSLAALNPIIAKEWHPTLNKDLKPEQVKSNSSKRVWWRCEKQHKWQATVCYRTKYNGRCPQCSGYRTNENNSLAALRPELAAEWHPSKNRLLYPDIQGSFKSTMNRQNCRLPEEPPRRNRRLRPSDVSINSNELVHWICRRNPEHEWDATVVKRAVEGCGCPYCSGRKTARDNSLAAKFPAIAKLWHPTRNLPTTPWDVRPGEAREVYWRCPRSATHVWTAFIFAVVASHEKNGTSGCPFCAGKKIDERNNLATKYPEVAKHWHPKRNLPLLPSSVTPHSHKAVWWNCPKSKLHTFQKPVREVVQSWQNHRSTGCGSCNGAKASADNSLKALFPEVAGLWHPIRNAPLLPSNVKPSSKKMVAWQCRNGRTHEWEQTIAQVTAKYKRGGTVCPFCAGRSAAHGNNVWDRYPDLARYWDPERNLPTKPWEVMPGSRKRCYFRCTADRGHRWNAEIREMVDIAKAGKLPCPICRKLARRDLVYCHSAKLDRRRTTVT